MNWDNRKYHFYLLFVNKLIGKEPWSKTEWELQIHPILNKIIQHSTHYDKTGLDVLAYTPKLNSKYYEEVKFGKLRWNNKSFEKWNLAPNDNSILFLRLESWTPMRSICGKTNSPPDIYFSIKNEQIPPNIEKLDFDIFISFAIAEDLNYSGIKEILELSNVLNSKKTVYTQRRWGSVADQDNNAQWSFVNSIQDTTSFGIYKSETLNIHYNKFEDLKFEPYWKIIQTQ